MNGYPDLNALECPSRNISRGQILKHCQRQWKNAKKDATRMLHVDMRLLSRHLRVQKRANSTERAVKIISWNWLEATYIWNKARKRLRDGNDKIRSKVGIIVFTTLAPHLKFRIQAKYIYKTKFQNFRNASYRIKSHRANRIFWKNVVKRWFEQE